MIIDNLPEQININSQTATRLLKIIYYGDVLLINYENTITNVFFSIIYFFNF